jgi:hypothetical protein
MPRLAALALVVVALVALGGYRGQAQEAATLEDRVAALEAQLARIEANQATLTAAVLDLEASVLPPFDPTDPRWATDGFRLTCHWAPIPQDPDQPHPGMTLAGTCLRPAAIAP